MTTIIGIVIAVVFLDMPWTALLIGGFLVVDAFEIWLWLRWRKRRSITGAEGIVGARGRAVSALKPEGQVRVKGQIWKAISSETVPAGTHVEVVATEGIRLAVKPVETPVPTLPA